MKNIIVSSAALLLVACATPTPNAEQPAADDKSYVTGSRLAVKDKSAGSSTVIKAAPPPAGAPRAAGVPSNTLGTN